MIVHLLREFAPLLDRVSAVASGDSRVFLSARIAVAAVAAFLTAVLLGPAVIRQLRGRCGERVASASAALDALHAGKNATPTMGGVFLVAAVVAATLLCGDLSQPPVRLAILAAVAFGTIGAADDWIKLSWNRRGLTPRQKLTAQTVMAVLLGVLLHRHLAAIPHGLELVWPLGGGGIMLGAMFPLWAALVMVGGSNAVNLTDGLDGLAAGCTVFTAAALAGVSYLAGHAVWSGYVGIPHVPDAGEMAVVLAAVGGAMLGFLWFNAHPAEVFMGDSGSLPTGALLGLTALACRQEAVLLVAGGVFVAETLSVIVQIGGYRLTGRRLLACSPLHNHCVLRGGHEAKVVVRFWIASAVLSVLALASLKID